MEFILSSLFSKIDAFNLCEKLDYSCLQVEMLNVECGMKVENLIPFLIYLWQFYSRLSENNVIFDEITNMGHCIRTLAF